MDIPERGFYYHYKHDPSGVPNNYMYEVVGIGWHTEDEAKLVLYRPLYGDKAYLEGADMAARPLEMFIGNVEKEGKTFPRFTRITDTETVARLQKITTEMYGA